MLSKIEHNLNTYLKVRENIVLIFSDAGSCERFLAAPGNKNVPSMYQLIETSYLKSEHGYWDKTKLKLRATPRQMTHYGLAIDMILEVKEDISDDPVLDRKLLWLRANRIKWSTMAKMFGKHRTTVKKMYEIILNRLATKINATMLDKYDKFFI